MSITINDIARIANVSKATVSAVLNSKPGISQATRDRVLEIVTEMKYRPSHIARSLSTRRTGSIGLVTKEIDNPYFSKLMKGVFDTCSNSDYTVLLGSSELIPEREIQSIETLMNQGVDGLIISPLHGDSIDYSYLSDLIRDKFPLVTLGHVPNFQTTVVEIDNIRAARQATTYLIEQGHRRILFFSGPPYSIHSLERRKGYEEAMNIHGVEIPESDILSSGSYIIDGYEKGRRFFLDNTNHPTAVLCYNDLVAIGLINALTELGIWVPDDISIIGFDDIDFSSSFKIPLTTVHIPAYDIGRKAAEMLIQQIQLDIPRIRQLVIEPKFIIRDSVSKPASA